MASKKLPKIGKILTNKDELSSQVSHFVNRKKDKIENNCRRLLRFKEKEYVRQQVIAGRIKNSFYFYGASIGSVFLIISVERAFCQGKLKL